MTSSSRPSRVEGFTLIELLIALSILAILSFMAYRGISALITAEQRLKASTKRIQDIDRFFAEIERDILFSAPRLSRVSATTVEPAFVGQMVAGMHLLKLARFATDRNASPQRIHYVFSPPTLGIAVTTRLDFPDDIDVQPVAVLDRLRSASLRFLDRDGRWLASWPPAGQTEAMPVSVEITLVLDDLGTISRMVTRP